MGKGNSTTKDTTKPAEVEKVKETSKVMPGVVIIKNNNTKKGLA